jgi:AraC-like DNA-binding protein
MISCRHIPGEALARFIDWFWFYEDWQPLHRREHVLPDGTFELVINLREEQRKLFDRREGNRYTTFRRGWISGTHSEYIIIDALPDSSMIGVHFKPGGASPFLGMPAGELANRVVELDAIWGGCSWELRERLLTARGAQGKFRVLEEFLLDRLQRCERDDTQQRRVSWALERFLSEPQALTIRSVVDQLGISHKHFIAQFRQQVGLTPKLFCRLQRFQQVLSRITAQESVEWADIACDCGYFDQAHFVHDFQAFAGLNPTRYLGHQLTYPNFVPVDD